MVECFRLRTVWLLSCWLLGSCLHKVLGDGIVYSFASNINAAKDSPVPATVTPTLTLPDHLLPTSRYETGNYVMNINSTVTAYNPTTSYFSLRIVSTLYDLYLTQLSFKKSYLTEQFHQMGYRLTTSLDNYASFVPGTGTDYIPTTIGAVANLAALPPTRDITLRISVFIRPDYNYQQPPPVFDVYVTDLRLQWESVCTGLTFANGTITGNTPSRSLATVRCVVGLDTAADDYQCLNGVYSPTPLCIPHVECGIPNCVRTKVGCKCAACGPQYTLNTCNNSCIACTSCVAPYQFEQAPCRNNTDRICGINTCVIANGGCDAVNANCVPQAAVTNTCVCKRGFVGTGVGAGSCIPDAAFSLFTTGSNPLHVLFSTASLLITFVTLFSSWS